MMFDLHSTTLAHSIVVPIDIEFTVAQMKYAQYCNWVWIATVQTTNVI